jgi:hypothetical protein
MFVNDLILMVFDTNVKNAENISYAKIAFGVVELATHTSLHIK